MGNVIILKEGTETETATDVLVSVEFAKLKIKMVGWVMYYDSHLYEILFLKRT